MDPKLLEVIVDSCTVCTTCQLHCRRNLLLLHLSRWWHYHRWRLGWWLVQHKSIINFRQFNHSVLLQAHEATQAGRLLSSAAHAVYYVPFLLLSHEKDVENFNLEKQFIKI